MQTPDLHRSSHMGATPATGTIHFEQYVCVLLGKQSFGIPVLKVQDVLDAQHVTAIPLAPPEIAGSLNLRGRIVTAIDLRRRLNMPASGSEDEKMSVVIERDGELYSLLVDGVGEVLSLSNSTFEPNPSTLDRGWREVSTGVHRLDDELLIILDVARLLELGTGEPK